MVRRWVPALALVLGGVWWWAVLRLLLEPASAGPVEGAVAAGGWGLSLLPVHVAATARPTGIFDAGTGLLRRCAEGMRAAGRSWRESGPSGRTGLLAGRTADRLTGRAAGRSWSAAGAWRAACAWCAAGVWRTTRAWRATRAWRRRRSGGGSGRS